MTRKNKLTDRITLKGTLPEKVWVHGSVRSVHGHAGAWAHRTWSRAPGADRGPGAIVGPVVHSRRGSTRPGVRRQPHRGCVVHALVQHGRGAILVGHGRGPSHLGDVIDEGQAIMVPGCPQTRGLGLLATPRLDGHKGSGARRPPSRRGSASHWRDGHPPSDQPRARPKDTAG